MDNFYVHHVLHSFALLKLASFDRVKSVVDIGTGGGFPGIPLAIALPDIQFHLVDSIGKKIQVVKTIAEDIGLTNLKATHSRVENIDEKFDMAVSRAVAPTKELIQWMQHNWISKPNMAFLKGGDLSAELNEALELNAKFRFKSFSIYEHIPEPGHHPCRHRVQHDSGDVHGLGRPGHAASGRCRSRRDFLSAMAVAAIELTNLCHWYGTGSMRRQVLQGVNLAVAPGEVVLLTGPSGCGKTTLLTLVGALRQVQQGSVRVLGQQLDGASRR